MSRLAFPRQINGCNWPTTRKRPFLLLECLPESLLGDCVLSAKPNCAMSESGRASEIFSPNRMDRHGAWSAGSPLLAQRKGATG
jgi:hypothetical protein